MRIADSARKRGIAEEDMLHALRHVLRTIPGQGDHELTMYIGPARNGTVLEIGVIGEEEDARIVHAMRARRKYWP